MDIMCFAGVDPRLVFIYVDFLNGNSSEGLMKSMETLLMVSRLMYDDISLH